MSTQRKRSNDDQQYTQTLHKKPKDSARRSSLHTSNVQADPAEHVGHAIFHL